MSLDTGSAAVPALLEVKGLAVSFGGVQAVTDATFFVRPGTITGLIGPNGAGKSTVIDLISGRAKASAGLVSFAGEELTGKRPFEVARTGLIRTFQKANVFDRLTVVENMLVGANRWSGETLWNALRSKSVWENTEDELVDQAYDLLRRFDLEPLANEYAGSLSGGQKRLVELMRALMASPKMLLLDEPMAGVNPSLALEIADFLREMKDDGITMLMVEHELRIVEKLCDPIVVMARGRVLAEGSMRELQENEEVIDAYLGSDAGY